MNDLISIIVPVYNVENYIQKCIDSILNQTYKFIEIILVDDGSTDNSSKICDTNQKKDKRIKVIHKKNGGLSSARNVGIKHATGKYLTFIDSDDYINKNFLSILYANLVNYNADISCCSLVRIKKNSIEKNNSKQRITIFNSMEALEDMLYQKKLDNSACAKLYKKSLFKDIQYPLDFFFEDMATTYKLYLKSKTIVKSNLGYYYYFQREGSILHKKQDKNITDLLKILQTMQNDLRKIPELDKAMESRIINAQFYIHRNSSNKNFKEQSKNYIKNNRKKVFNDKNINKKTKIGIILSYFGIWTVDFIYSLKV